MEIKNYEQTKKRLVSKINIDGNGCWNWTGSKNTSGYGNIVVGSRTDDSRSTQKAHRVSYCVFNGIDPREKDVCHKCDNPSCINPNHLFLGTAKDNVDDMIAKGRKRVAIAERHGIAKLSRSIVREAKSLYAQGVPYVRLAEKYGVVRSTIRAAVLGVSWKCCADDTTKPETEGD